MIHLPTDFKEFLKLLNDKQIRYLLIGGYAVGYYGYPRATGDMDIWLSSEPKNIQKLVSTLREFGFDVPELKEELFMQRDKIVRMGVPPLRLELMTSIDGVDFESCYLNRNQVELDDIPVSLIGLADLRTNKKASGRHKDMNDLEHLPS